MVVASFVFVNNISSLLTTQGFIVLMVLIAARFFNRLQYLKSTD